MTRALESPEEGSGNRREQLPEKWEKEGKDRNEINQDDAAYDWYDRDHQACWGC